MLDAIKNELVSVSELKKAPMSVIELAKEKGNGVYILNNNKAVAVILDTETYVQFLEDTLQLHAENEKLLDQLIELESEKRLGMQVDYLSDEEVRGTNGK